MTVFAKYYKAANIANYVCTPHPILYYNSSFTKPYMVSVEIFWVL